jgi:hypothetical protein
MSVALVVVLVVLGVLLLLALVGGAMASRRNRAGEAGLHERLTAIDRQLAAATAADRGWQRDALEAAARSELAARRPDAQIAQLELLQIVDEPGTDDDLAVFRIVTGPPPVQTSRLTLGRRDGAWHAVALEDER